MAFTVESVTEPPNLFVSALRPFAPVVLSSLNKQLKDVANAKVEVLKWRSKDKKWTVQGVLVKPPDYTPDKRYPLLLLLEGGPSMVRMGYDLSYFGVGYYSPQLFAANGYLVLVPNTRGRSGSGRAFSRAIIKEQSFGPNPFADAMAGVEMLVKKGVADQSHLGIMGGSYGGYLAAYAITQTNMFKAAAIWEGSPTDIPHGLYRVAANPNTSRLTKGTAFQSAFDRKQLKAMLTQSPVQNFRHVKTPLLLQYGILSLASSDGLVLFQAARYFHVPSEFIVYPRTAHALTEPLLREDSFKRSAAWFDKYLKAR